jgi:hypothetical protein
MGQIFLIAPMMIGNQKEAYSKVFKGSCQKCKGFSNLVSNYQRFKLKQAKIYSLNHQKATPSNSDHKRHNTRSFHSALESNNKAISIIFQASSRQSISINSNENSCKTIFSLKSNSRSLPIPSEWLDRRPFMKNER